MTIREYPGPEETNFDKMDYATEYTLFPRREWGGFFIPDKPEKVIGYVVNGDMYQDSVAVTLPNLTSNFVAISIKERPWRHISAYLDEEELDELMLVLMYAKQELEKRKKK